MGIAGSHGNRIWIQTNAIALRQVPTYAVWDTEILVACEGHRLWRAAWRVFNRHRGLVTA
jgi:hypothetical protein